MFLFAFEEMFTAFSYGASFAADVRYWQERILLASALIPGAWFVFSISYARAKSSAIQPRWKWGMAALCLVPATFFAIFRSSLFAGSVRSGRKENTSIRMVGMVLNIHPDHFRADRVQH
jgi:hypothetical protein